MVPSVGMDSAAVSLLMSYNSNQAQLNQVSNAASTGYDINKSSDDAVRFADATNLRSQASIYNDYIPKLTQDKSSVDRLQSTLSTITSTANNIRNMLTGLPSGATSGDIAAAATSITSYLKTIDNLINSSQDQNGFGLLNNSVQVQAFAKVPGAAAATGAYVGVLPTQALTFTGPNLSIANFLTSQTALSTAKAKQLNAQNSVMIQGEIWVSYKPQVTTGAGTVIAKAINGHQQNVNYYADLSTVTARGNFLTAISNFIDNTLTQAASSVGAFANALDSSLQNMQTLQSGLNSEADALTKTDLTKDSAQSTALSTQQQLITSLLSMSNQRMSGILSLFR